MVITLNIDQVKAQIAELEAKDELTPDDMDKLAELKATLAGLEGSGTPTDGGSLNIGG